MEAFVEEYTDEFPEDTLWEIPLLKICGRMGDMEIPGAFTGCP